MKKGIGEKVVIPTEPRIDTAKLKKELEAEGALITKILKLLEQSKRVRGEILRQPFTIYGGRDEASYFDNPFDIGRTLFDQRAATSIQSLDSCIQADG